MRDLLRQKLDGQERVLRTFTAGQLALPLMELGRRALVRATDFISLRSAEARSAAAYWATWGSVPVEFRASERDRIPKHWLTFGQRVSALSGSPRLAVTPANALLNYLYGVLEIEARLALLAVGCDPGVGIQLWIPSRRQFRVASPNNAPSLDASYLRDIFGIAAEHTPTPGCPCLPYNPHPPPSHPAPPPSTPTSAPSAPPPWCVPPAA